MCVCVCVHIKDFFLYSFFSVQVKIKKERKKNRIRQMVDKKQAKKMQFRFLSEFFLSQSFSGSYRNLKTKHVRLFTLTNEGVSKRNANKIYLFLLLISFCSCSFFLLLPQDSRLKFQSSLLIINNLFMGIFTFQPLQLKQNDCLPAHVYIQILKFTSSCNES